MAIDGRASYTVDDFVSDWRRHVREAAEETEVIVVASNVGPGGPVALCLNQAGKASRPFFLTLSNAVRARDQLTEAIQQAALAAGDETVLS